MKVLVAGAAGQLGQAMVARLKGEHEVIGWTRADVDLTRHREVRDAIAAMAPNAIVNCASYNQVDKCQDDQVTAFEVNAMVVGTLARAAAELVRPRMLFFSLYASRSSLPISPTFSRYQMIHA